MWVYGWKLLTASHHFAMFGDNWLSASGDLKYLILHDLTKLWYRDQVTLWVGALHGRVEICF